MILSVDDGCASDVRVADLARKYGIETVFYWPVELQSLAYEKGYEPLYYTDALDIAEKHEIGSHTITHRHLTKLPLAEACREIQDSKDMLEALYDRAVTKFAPPRGYTNPELTEFTLTIYKSQRLTKGDRLVHIHPNSGANGNIDWKMRVKLMKEHGQEVKEAFCHSWELDIYNLWDELEEFLSENSPS